MIAEKAVALEPGSQREDISRRGDCDGEDTLLHWGRQNLQLFLFSSPDSFPGGASGKEPTCQCRRDVIYKGWEDPLDEGMAIHSSILAWRIPMDRGAWWATIHEVTKRRT